MIGHRIRADRKIIVYSSRMNTAGGYDPFRQNQDASTSHEDAKFNHDIPW